MNQDNYKNSEQIEDLLESAQEIVEKDTWIPHMAMIDKSMAEKNALKAGMEFLLYL